MTLESEQPQCVLSPAVAVEPESEKFALSPTADLGELREFVRCESLERMQLCMRLQKQQEMLEQLTDGVVPVCSVKSDVAPGIGSMKLSDDLIVSEGPWLKQVAAEVDALKLSMQNLTQDVKELQECLDTRPRTGSLVLKSGGCQAVDEFVDDARFAQCDVEGSPCYKAGSEGESFGGGLNFEPALDLQWLEERFEDVQQQCAADLTSVEQRLLDEFTSLKGFVDAAIVAMVSRMSTLEIFVKGERGLSEKMDEGFKKVADDIANSTQRLQGCQDEVSELTDRLKAVEKRLERPSGQLVGYSPAPGYRSPADLRRSGESNDSVKTSAIPEKSPAPEVVLASPPRVLSHAGPVGTPMTQLLAPGRGHSMQVPPGAAPAGWMPASPLPQVFRPLPGGSSSPQLVASVLATPRRENSASPWRQRPSEVFAARPSGIPSHIITPRAAFGTHIVPAVHIAS
ncbi:pcrA [Symbiodinium sp. CCMP2592]|nr:pcrA [Symbiodinium sp. CCMP2592]